MNLGLGKQESALLLTLLIEMPVAYGLVRFLPWWRMDGGRGAWDAAWSAAVASLITHSFAWRLAVFWTQKLGFWHSFWMVEAAVVMVEAMVMGWILRLPWWQAFLLSLLVNGVSAGIGLLIEGGL